MAILRETYLPHSTEQSLVELQEFRKRHEIPNNFSNTALLVVDMQDFFLQPDSHAYIPSSDAIIPNINKIQNLCHELKIPIIHTQHIDVGERALHRKRWWGSSLLADDPLNKISQKVAQKGAFIMQKNHYDAFRNTGLLTYLQHNKIRQLIITGVMTHLCCESTARSAFQYGFDVLFMVDATATYNQHFHKATLLNLAHGFACMATTDEFVKQCKITK